MAKTLAEMPEVRFTGEDIMTGGFPTRLAAAAEQHGPIYKWTIRQGLDAGEYVFMVGPEANRFVLHTHRHHFSHDQGWTPVIGDVMGRGLLNMDDPEHARHRKIWNPAFTSASIEAYLPVLHRVIVARTADWSQRGVVNVYREAREITFDAAAATLAGLEPGPEVDRLRNLFYTLLHGVGDDTPQTLETYMTAVGGAQRDLVGMLLAEIAARRRASPDAPPRDVISTIIHARDERGQELSDAQVLGHLNILLVAGHETTTTLGAWVLYLLATQPQQRARVEAEIATLLGAQPGPVPVEAVRAMRVLDNFIREAGRLYSPVINVPRGVVQDFEFGGYHVPAGTPVRLSLAGGHRLARVFADPDRFDPDRFAPPREEDKQIPYALVTFGGGPRICIGVNFANIEVKALVAHVLRTYHLEAVQPPPPHAGHWAAILPGGIRLRATPRA